MAVQYVVDHDAARATVMVAVRDLDGDAVRQLLARTIRSAGVDFTVTQVMVPALRQIGDAWASGELSVMHEHFASNTFRGVLGHVRARSPGRAHRAVVLACPPGELHDLPLELFGALLRARGWRVVTLGANTPLGAIQEAVRLVRADACVLASVRQSVFESQALMLAELAAGTKIPVFLAGQGAIRLSAAPRGTTILLGDMRRAAELVHALPPAPTRQAGRRTSPGQA
jgi:methanogenic corrinoid protein MtbC1